jgi:single-strand DNA-binding protein
MLNVIHLIGRLGSDPEIKVLESGTSIANYSLATDKKYKNKAGETVQDTQWHRIVCFGTLAELADKYLKKGSLIYITGEIKYRSYESKDGEKKYITEIFANGMKFLDTKKESGGSEQKHEQQAQVPHSEPDAGDDLPF